MTRVHLTPRGRALLERRIDALRSELRTIQAQKGAAAQEGGDNWHDNFAFEDLERQERMLSRHLADMSARLTLARTVEPPRDRETVQLGHAVLVLLEDGNERMLRIAGHGESDPERGVIAYDTPLAKALIGAAPGEERCYRAGGRVRSVRVERIAFDGELERSGSAPEARRS